MREAPLRCSWHTFRRRAWPAWVCLIAAVFTIDLTGCGAFVRIRGDALDQSRRDVDAEKWLNVENVSPGTPIAVSLRDGTVVLGEYVGTTRVSDAEYATRYSAWRDTTSVRPLPPAIGAEVRVDRLGRRAEHGRFQGFDYRSLRITQGSAAKSKLLLFEDVGTLRDSVGPAVSADQLSAWLMLGQLPCASALVITRDHVVRRIPLEQVATLKAKNGKNWTPAVIASVGLLVLLVYEPRASERDACGGSIGSLSGAFSSRTSLSDLRDEHRGELVRNVYPHR